MASYTFPTGKDPAFMLGCGRLRMEEHLLENCAGEILRLGRNPLFVCDRTSRALAFGKVAGALGAEGVRLREVTHSGFCCREDALALAGTGALDGADVVLGCGGGVILDFSKCLADIAGAPLVTIPTSSATCCAYTPIAVCYTREGRYVSTSHFRREVAAALLDTAILCGQPRRLLAAGALDAMAKKIEIEFWDTIPAAGDGGTAAPAIASAVSDYIYSDIDAKIDTALEDLGRGVPTRALLDVIYCSIAGAGFVSGISGGSRQVALAHRLYYGARTLAPELASRFTHGEIVAVGLVLQLAYYGRDDEAARLAARLRSWGLAATMGELGLPHGPAEAESYVEYIMGTKTMKAVGPSGEAPLRRAMAAVFK